MQTRLVASVIRQMTARGRIGLETSAALDSSPGSSGETSTKHGIGCWISDKDEETEGVKA